MEDGCIKYNEASGNGLKTTTIKSACIIPDTGAFYC
jgi:hypothetical protein